MDVATQIEQLEKSESTCSAGKGWNGVTWNASSINATMKTTGRTRAKIQMLQNPDALCPLCDRPLDEHHWNRVVDKTRTQQQETQEQFWVVREQMAVSEREIQILRQEYQELSGNSFMMLYGNSRGS